MDFVLCRTGRVLLLKGFELFKINHLIPYVLVGGGGTDSCPFCATKRIPASKLITKFGSVLRYNTVLSQLLLNDSDFCLSNGIQ